MLLSICIPTFDNHEILLTNINKIVSDLSNEKNNFEIVISENYSNDNSRAALLLKVPDAVKLVCHNRNIGFSRNLLSALSTARGKFILILGDDDIPELGLLPDLMERLKSKKDKSLIFLPLSDTPNPEVLPKNAIIPWAFMRSGSMMGIVFHTDSLYLNEVQFYKSIYPQVRLAILSVIRDGLSNERFSKSILVGHGLPLNMRFRDKMNRPTDFGVVERTNIIKSIRDEHLISYKSYLRCRTLLMEWAVSTYKLLSKSGSAYKNIYLLTVLHRSPGRALSLASICYVLLKNYCSERKLNG